VPNRFSPNDDGVNDRLIVYRGEAITEVEGFQVFDPWGNRLFQQESFPSNSFIPGWNGRDTPVENRPSKVYQRGFYQADI
jgi:hypothetical protein